LRPYAVSSRRFAPAADRRKQPAAAGSHSAYVAVEPGSGRPIGVLSTLLHMIERPTGAWRTEAARQEGQVRAGTLVPDEAYALRLCPADFLTAVDAALANFEHATTTLEVRDDEAVWSIVERVVLDLNTIADRTGLIETEEREQLCEYIDAVLTAKGVDIPALTASRGLGPHELTDTWRDW